MATKTAVAPEGKRPNRYYVRGHWEDARELPLRDQIRAWAIIIAAMLFVAVMAFCQVVQLLKELGLLFDPRAI